MEVLCTKNKTPEVKMIKIAKTIQSLLIGLSLTGLLLAACGPAATVVNPPPTQMAPVSTNPPSQSTPPPVGTDALAGSKWQLTSINGATLVNASAQPKPVTLEFGSKGEVNGNGGCNSYGGTYTVQNDSLTFSPIISTKMACVDEGMMQQENQYFQILQSSSKFSLAPETLTVTGNGPDTLVFTNASIP
jgi:putative lipoprotein